MPLPQPARKPSSVHAVLFEVVRILGAKRCVRAMLLNTFRDRAARAIEQQRGIVDKFIGDGVTGVFGVPESGN
jgi:hypothetical protein